MRQPNKSENFLNVEMKSCAFNPQGKTPDVTAAYGPAGEQRALSPSHVIKGSTDSLDTFRQRQHNSSWKEGRSATTESYVEGNSFAVNSPKYRD